MYPSRLAELGLLSALRSAALRSPLPIDVDFGPVGRHSGEIETAVYFVCLEAMQNAAKHASGATAVWISLRENSALRFEIRDDGPGFAEETAEPGAGLTNMHDRLAAVGGELTVDSAPGRGTRIIGTVPLA